MINNKIAISNIYILSPYINNTAAIKDMFSNGILSNNNFPVEVKLEIDGIMDNIESRLKTRMSQLSLGVFQALQNGGGKNLKESDEIYLFSAFAEIETTDKIINDIVINGSHLVSPMAFHNSVHNTPLGYYTIIKKLHNYSVTVSDGINTGRSFATLIPQLMHMNSEAVIVSGDEYSNFYNLEIANKRTLPPLFTSYRIKNSDKEGFSLSLQTNNLNKLIEHLASYDRCFCSGDIFNKLKKSFDENFLFTDAPITFDHPTAIVTRLTLPFILELPGKTAVIEHCQGKYFLFEVTLK